MGAYLEYRKNKLSSGASTSAAATNTATSSGTSGGAYSRYRAAKLNGTLDRASSTSNNSYGVDDDIWSNVEKYKSAIHGYDWRSEYEYDLLDSDDLRRKTEGLVPYALEKRYDLDDALDRALYMEGLPSSKDLAKVAASASKQRAEDEKEIAQKQQLAKSQDTFQRLYQAAYNNDLKTYNSLEDEISALKKLEEKASKNMDSAEYKLYNRLAAALGKVQEENELKTARQERQQEYKEQLDDARDEYKRQTNALNPGRADVARELNAIENKIREINTLANAGAQTSELEALERQRAALMGQVKTGNEAAAAIEQQYIDARAARRDEMISANLQPYAGIPNADDFAEFSRKGAQATGSRKHNSINASGVNKALHAGLIDYDGYGIYDYMTDDERATYNYLYAKNGEKSADEYLETLTPVLNRRYTGEVEAKNVQFAEDAPVLSDVVSVLYGIPKAASGVYAAVDTLFDGENVDPYDPMYSAGAAQSAIRNTRTEQLGDVWGFLYNTGMSILDTVLARGVGGKASLGIMGAGAMADTYQGALERGADPGQALVTGALAAISEAVFEKLSLDNWISLKTAGRGKTIKNLLRSMRVEASEEMATEIANIISDRIILGELGETHGKTLSELGGQVLLAGAGGALSGGVFTGLGAAANRISASRANRQAANQAEATTERAEAIPDSTEAKLNTSVDTTKEAAAVAEAPRAVAEASAAVEEAAAETPEQLDAEEAAERPRINTPLSPTVPGLTRNATPRALQEAARRLAESSGKGVNNKTMAEASGAINSQLKAIDALGKRYGISIEIRDSIEAIDADGNVVQSALSGYYDPQTRRVVIAADATDQAYTFVATHELVHYIKDSGAESYSTLEATVFEALEAAGEDVEALIQQQIEQQGYDESSAREEVVANSVPAILTDEATVQRIVKTDRTLGERIAEFFKGFAQNLRNIFKSLAKRPGWTQMDAISKQADSMERISNAFFAALDESTAQTQESDATAIEQALTGEATDDLVLADDVANVTVKAATKEGSGVKSGEVFVDTSQASPREILAGALESAAQNKSEANFLKRYKEAINSLNETQAKFNEASAKLSKLKRENKTLAYTGELTAERKSRTMELQEYVEKLGANLDQYDKRLLNLEATVPLKDVIRRERTRIARNIANEYYERRRKDSSKRKETEERNKYITRIVKTSGELLRWLTNPNEKQKKYVPEALRGSTADFLRSIALETDSETQAKMERRRAMLEGRIESNEKLLRLARSKSEVIELTKAIEKDRASLENITTPGSRWNEKLEALKKEMQKIDKASVNGDGDTYLDVDPDMIAMLDQFIGATREVRSVSELDVDGLRELDFLLGILKHTITDVNTAHTFKRNKYISDAAARTMGDLANQAAKALSKLGRAFSNLLNIEQLDAFAYFHRLGTSAEENVGASLREGFDKKVIRTKEGIDFMDELLKDVDVSKLSGPKAKLETFELSNGTIKMTKAQIMELYLLNKRAQAQGHLYGGGFKLVETTARDGGKKTQVKMDAPIEVTPDDVKRITDTLSKDEKAIADAIQKFLGEECAAWGNEVSMTLYGYKKFTEANYYPIRSDTNYTLTQENESGSKGGELYRLRNLGMTKSTVQGANNPLIVGDIFDTFTRHVDEMATYNAFVVPLSDAMKWFNYRVKEDGKYGGSVKQSIEKAVGSAGKQYFVRLIKDINGIADHRGLEMTDRLVSNAKAASVGANIRVVLQQPTAYLRAASEIDAKYLAKGVFVKDGVEKALKYCPVALWKSWGFFDLNTGRSMRELIIGDQTVMQKTRKKAMALAQKADELTFGALWGACELEVRDTKPYLKPGSEDFNQAVGARLSEIIDKTQVVDTVLHRSQLMRNKDGLVKLYTSFMSEPTKSYNMVRTALSDYRLNPGKETARRLGRVCITHVATTVATAAAAALADATRNDEEDKEWGEKYVDAFWKNAFDGINPLGMIPVLRDVNSLISGYRASRADMQALEKTWSAMESLYKTLDKGEAITYKQVYNSVVAISSLSGIPVGNLMRDFNGLYATITGESLTK